jgi:protease II
MTAESVRHTKFASWYDPDAWMEKMKGPRWEALLDEEEQIVNKITENPAVKKRLTPFKAFYEKAAVKEEVLFSSGKVQIQYHSEFFQSWSWSNQTHETYQSRDLVATDTHVWVTRDVGDGAEDFALECFSQSKKLWSKHPVGPNVALVGDTLFYLSVKNKLIYHELWSCDAKTGKNVKCLYKEKDPQTNLAIEKHPDGPYLVCDHSQNTKYFHLPSLKVKDPYKPPSTWILPPLKEYGTVFVWPQEGLLITQVHGDKTVWRCSASKRPESLLHIEAGLILFDPFTNKQERAVLVSEPLGFSSYVYKDKELQRLSPPAPKGELKGQRIQAKSLDRTVVHGYIASKTKKPKALLVIGYGAYGIPTNMGSFKNRWAPLLESDWAICVGFLRGGGDHTEAWGKAGRREGRTKTLEDFETIIRQAQHLYSIPPEKTAIYGRSAGGLLVGGTLTNHPDGSLMSCVYTEVPYVDELRTTTNSELPLTVLEYDEFGNPRERLEDFLSVGLLSPADSATVIKTPNIFVLARTAVHDSQVFAYEPLKWIRRLRKSGGAPKVCIVDRNAGHFTAPDTQLQQWSLDCAILDSWTSSKF